MRAAAHPEAWCDLAERKRDSSNGTELAAARARIDAIDDQLLKLINERGALAQRIGRAKAASGSPVYAPDRERAILERLCKLNQGPLPDRVLRSVYREIMSGSFALERAQRVAFLGPLGSYSHLAATNKFGASVEYEPLAEIAATLREVELGRADLAVVPVENSLGGGVQDTLEALLTSSLKVCAEVVLRIRHNLLSHAAVAKIERVYSKPEVFQQCKQWLLETGLLQKTSPAASSAKAAELASKHRTAAAIGSTLAAELHGLPVQVAGIEDQPNNITRFFVVGREAARRTGQDKTSLLFTTAHKAGALVGVLSAFSGQGVNLTMIASLPSRRSAWEYYFFVDADGHADDAAMKSALAEARQHCLHLTVLGSYPQPGEPI